MSTIGKHGFLTLRDLFKWAQRAQHTVDELSSSFSESKHQTSAVLDWQRILTEHGYLLLGGRLRKPEQVQVRSKNASTSTCIGNLQTFLYDELLIPWSVLLTNRVEHKAF